MPMPVQFRVCPWNQFGMDPSSRAPLVLSAHSAPLLTGHEAKDYDRLARKEHLKPIEVMLRMMEDGVSDVYHTYHYFKDREAEMRDSSGVHLTQPLPMTQSPGPAKNASTKPTKVERKGRGQFGVVVVSLFQLNGIWSSQVPPE